MSPEPGVSGRRLLTAAFLCALLTLFQTWPFPLEMARSVPGGHFGAASQLGFWLSWQVWDNLSHFRLPDDASILVYGGENGILPLVGNPGPVFFLWPLQALKNPLLAWNLGLLLVLWMNGLGGWLLGHSLQRPGDRVPLPWIGACAMLTAGWTLAQLLNGALPAAWLGPALAAVAWSRMGHRRLAIVSALVGLIGSPLLTGLILLGAVRWESRSPGLLGLLGVAVGLLVKTVGATSPIALPLTAFAWPGAGAAVGWPLWVLPALCLGASRERWAISLIFWLILVGPVAMGADGNPLQVEGYTVPLPFSWNILHHREILGALMGLALLPALRLAATHAVGRFRFSALLLFLLLEPGMQASLGQPVAFLFHGEPQPLRVPDAFRELAANPRSTALLQLPLFDVTEGGVFWIPFHQQRISGGPGIAADGPVREALRALVSSNPAFGDLHNKRYNADIRPQRTWKEAGFGQVVLFGNDPEFDALLQQFLGDAAWGDEAGEGWVIGDAAPGGPPKPGGQQKDGGAPGDPGVVGAIHPSTDAPAPSAAPGEGPPRTPIGQPGTPGVGQPGTPGAPVGQPGTPIGQPGTPGAGQPGTPPGQPDPQDRPPPDAVRP